MLEKRKATPQRHSRGYLTLVTMKWELPQRGPRLHPFSQHLAATAGAVANAAPAGGDNTAGWTASITSLCHKHASTNQLATPPIDYPINNKRNDRRQRGYVNCPAVQVLHGDRKFVATFKKDTAEHTNRLFRQAFFSCSVVCSSGSQTSTSIRRPREALENRL